MSAGIVQHFASLEDPRIDRNKLHALIDIVLLTICTVVSGADGWEAIEDFGRESNPKSLGIRLFGMDLSRK